MTSTWKQHHVIAAQLDLLRGELEELLAQKLPRDARRAVKGALSQVKALQRKGRPVFRRAEALGADAPDGNLDDAAFIEGLQGLREAINYAKEARQ